MSQDDLFPYCLSLFRASRYVEGGEAMEEQAFALLEQIQEQVATSPHPLQVARWGALLQVLLRQGLVEGDGDELLEEATEASFGTEFMDYKMAVKTVDSLDDALEHIARFGSGHSECIITEDEAAAAKFLQLVDAACVYSNAPTSFTDGAQFGLGAEIGISTQKLHARGPMALEEMTTYKWLIRGDGQVRPK